MPQGARSGKRIDIASQQYFCRVMVMNPAALQALAEPNRLAMLDMLAAGERPAGDFVRALPIAQPTVSKHLGVLKEAGLVTVRKDGTRRLYSLDPRPLAELDAWLETYRRFWSARLDALEAHLDREFPQ
jgi:DNA-binding transcriptional ArsR family regulator